MKLGILVGDIARDLKIPLREAIRKARGWGYDAVELPANDLSRSDEQYSPDTAKSLISFISDLGLEVTGFQCHVGYLTDDWQARVDHTKRMIEVASEIGVPVVHTVTGKLPEDMAIPSGFSRLEAVYRELLEFAEGSGVKVGIEPVFVYLVGNHSTLKRLIELVGRDDLYINFDPSHYPYHGESPIPTVKEFGKRIVHTHMKDALIEPKFRFIPPGKGVLDFREIISALHEVGYDYVLSLELGHGMEDPEGMARENVGFLAGLLEELGIERG